MFNKSPAEPGSGPRLPSIPEYTIHRCIGVGSYGKVWLAESVLGTYRAIKIIDRHSFPIERPFDREFQGIKKFEPVSRSHEGLVSVLHVGRNAASGYFYYVMELADDVATGQKINPSLYVPRTLNSDLARFGKLPLADCLFIGQSLSSALGHLHRHGLVHRDIKPSNIIFIGGLPKFADIGLVSTIGERATFVGTEGYVPPEGPGQPAADLYGLGKVLYEISTGKNLDDFPQFPLRTAPASPAEKALQEAILKCCDLNPRRRFLTGEAMSSRLETIAAGDPSPAGAQAAPDPASSPLQVALLYQRQDPLQAELAHFLETELTKLGCRVFAEKHSTIGLEEAAHIEEHITNASLVIPLLSDASLESEMLAYEIEIAQQAFQRAPDKLGFGPIALSLSRPIPLSLAAKLDPQSLLIWTGPADNDRLLAALKERLRGRPSPIPENPPKLESVGGAVPLDSRFYVERPADGEFRAAIARADSIVLVKGARQMGKTSLLARGLQTARGLGMKVVLTDFQQLNRANLDSLDSLYRALGEGLADQLDLKTLPDETWDPRRSPNTNFERYVSREVLAKTTGTLVWGLDEVDRLFSSSFATEVFGLFRSWHNKRALEPAGPWGQLVLAIAYATEAHLFITDLVQSPFNVGTRLVLDDFDEPQLVELNRRYGEPLATADALQRFRQLVGGQPFLVRRGLHELASQHVDIASFEAAADRDEGFFGDHLRRLLVSLARDPALTEIVRGLLQGRPCPNEESFYRLRSAGLLVGEAASSAKFRSDLYRKFLQRHLGG